MSAALSPSRPSAGSAKLEVYDERRGRRSQEHACAPRRPRRGRVSATSTKVRRVGTVVGVQGRRGSGHPRDQGERTDGSTPMTPETPSAPVRATTASGMAASPSGKTAASSIDRRAGRKRRQATEAARAAAIGTAAAREDGRAELALTLARPSHALQKVDGEHRISRCHRDEARRPRHAVHRSVRRRPARATPSTARRRIAVAEIGCSGHRGFSHDSALLHHQHPATAIVAAEAIAPPTPAE